MKTKKVSSLNFEKTKTMFFNLGLFISSCLALMAFSWKTPNAVHKSIIETRSGDTPIEYVVEEIETPKVVELTKSKSAEPVTPPSLNTDLTDEYLEGKSTDKDPSLNVVSSFHLSIDDINLGEAPELEAVVKFPDFEASFDGDWYGFLRENIKYPEESLLWQESGDVYLSFIVNKSGEINNIEVLNGGKKKVSESLQNEAIRVLKSSPNWIPGSVNGEKVDSYKYVKISFKIIE